MFVLDEVAPQNETATKTFTILGHQTEVTYYRNKLTMEDTRRGGDESEADEDGDTADSVAARLVGLIKTWDWQGPVKRLDGTVAVEPGATIPLDIETVRLIPLRVTKALNEAIVEAELGGKREQAAEALALRALHPNLFEMERAKQDEGRPSLIDSLRADTEQDLFDIQIAEILHVPAPLVPRLPLHWVGSAMTLLDARARIAEAQSKRAKRG